MVANFPSDTADMIQVIFEIHFTKLPHCTHTHTLSITVQFRFRICTTRIKYGRRVVLRESNKVIMPHHELRELNMAIASRIDRARSFRQVRH